MKALAVAPGLFALLLSSAAAADLRVKWDCYLPNAGVDCAMLETSLTSKIPFVKMVHAADDADVVVTITSAPAEDGTRYVFRFAGKRVDGYATEVQTTDRVPSFVDPTTATVRVMTKIERGLDDFMDQKVAAEVRDGKLTLELVDPVALPFAGRPEQSGVKWYVAPSSSAYFSDVEGVGINASGGASVLFNYSEPRWRLQQWIGVGYNRQSQPVPGTDETASISFVGASTSDVLSWAVTRDGRWNLGALFAEEKNPQANYRLRAGASAGIEFDVVPLQTVNMKNFGFRCAAGPELQHYDATNVQGVNQQIVAREFCDVYLAWHFAPVDLWAGLGETALLQDVDYRSFSASASTTWRVTDNFVVSPWVNVQQIHKAINEAAKNDVVYADPRKEIEASMLAAVQRGYTAPFGVQAGLTLRYLFGNGSLFVEDQRWKNVSNLR